MIQNIDLSLAYKIAIQKAIAEFKKTNLTPPTLNPDHGYAYDEFTISIEDTPIILLRCLINNKEQWYCYFPIESAHLGNGAKSGVFKCYQIQNNIITRWHTMALKKTTSMHISPEQANQSIQIWNHLLPASTPILLNNKSKHQTIDDYMYLIIPLVGNKDLSDAPGVAVTSSNLQTESRRIDFSSCCCLILDILNQVKTLHESGYIHSDLKPQNTRIHNSHAYIIDFDTVRKINPNHPDTMAWYQGRPLDNVSLQYCPPDKVWTQKFDIFGLAAMFSQMFGVYPFASRDKELTKVHELNADKISVIEQPLDLEELAQKIKLSPGYYSICAALDNKLSVHSLHTAIAEIILQMASPQANQRPSIATCYHFFNQLNQVLLLAKITTKGNEITTAKQDAIAKLYRIIDLIRHGIYHELDLLHINQHYTNQILLKNKLEVSSIIRKIQKAAKILDVSCTAIKNRLPFTSAKKKLFCQHEQEFKTKVLSSIFQNIATKSDKSSLKIQLTQHQDTFIKKAKLDKKRYPFLDSLINFMTKSILLICTAGLIAPIYRRYTGNTFFKMSNTHTVKTVQSTLHQYI